MDKGADVQRNSRWRQRLRKAIGYIQRRDWAHLKQEIAQHLAWKGLASLDKKRLSSGPTQPIVLWASTPFLYRSTLWENVLFDEFLEFERKVFGEEFPISAYDPYLIRYGEYRFALEILSPQRGETIADLGCESNIFILYLAYLGVRVLAVDLNPLAGDELQQKVRRAEEATGHKLNVHFEVQDVTQLRIESESVDKVIAISSIEHMFCEQGYGDQLAMAHIARILKPGGLATITLPMSGGGPFHEAPNGDEQFGAPYRLYTPQALAERILSHPELEVVSLQYLVHTTPDPRYAPRQFFRFWTGLSTEERQKWAWANAILATVFNPIIPQEEGDRHLEQVNTALICLRKKESSDN